MTRHFRLHTRDKEEAKAIKVESPVLGPRRRTKSASEVVRPPPPKRVRSIIKQEVEDEPKFSPASHLAHHLEIRRASEPFYASVPFSFPPSPASSSTPIPQHPWDAWSAPYTTGMPHHYSPLPKQPNSLSLFCPTPESLPLAPAPFTADSATFDGPFDYDYASSATPEDNHSMSSIEEDFHATPAFNPMELMPGYNASYCPPPMIATSNALGMDLGPAAAFPVRPVSYCGPQVEDGGAQWAASIFESGRMAIETPYIGGGSYTDP